MNFTAFVLESSNAACQPINDYILDGKGNEATVLTGQGYIPWDNRRVFRYGRLDEGLQQKCFG